MTPAPSLKLTIEKVLENYLRHKVEPYSAHPFQAVLRYEMPQAVRALVGDDTRYEIRGSPGLATWTHVPWTAILDQLVTDTPQRGFYPTFLFKNDMSGFYLTLNQGVTDIEANYKARASEVLQVRAAEYLAYLGRAPKGFQIGKISVGAPRESSPSLYDFGNIFSKWYAKDSIPTDDVLTIDIHIMLTAYKELVEKVEPEPDLDEPQDDQLFPEVLYEEKKNRRLHRRAERNQGLVKAVKQALGYRCQACSISFTEFYGPLGQDYIEAHHLIPISEIKKNTKLNPKTDFAVLCANCHRMIHRLEQPATIEKLKQEIEKQKTILKI
jgi:5-methylcytosine-specific restriction protein A